MMRKLLNYKEETVGLQEKKLLAYKKNELLIYKTETPDLQGRKRRREVEEDGMWARRCINFITFSITLTSVCACRSQLYNKLCG